MVFNLRNIYWMLHTAAMCLRGVLADVKVAGRGPLPCRPTVPAPACSATGLSLKESWMKSLLVLVCATAV